MWYVLCFYVFYLQNMRSSFYQGGREHWAENYTGTQSLRTTLFYSQFIIGCVQTFQPIILIHKRVNFVYQHLVCILIYRPLSYPSEFLNFNTKLGEEN